MADNFFKKAYDKGKEGMTDRISALRLRTYVFTALVIVLVALYFLIQTTMKASINVVDLVFIIVIQTITNAVFYPDGKLYGTRDPVYIKNKQSYNTKANSISEQKLFTELRHFCKVDFERRKQQYIKEECYFLGIEEKVLDSLRTKTEKEILRLKTYEYDRQLFVFNRIRRYKLFRLLFKKLPVKETQPETIMSAYEKKSTENVHDKSVGFDTANYLGSILKFVLIGVFIAYLGVEFQDGITWNSVFKTFLCIFTVISTAITSYASGEKSSKVYKNTFYLNLSNFIDEFFEWHDAKPKVQAETACQPVKQEIKLEQPQLQQKQEQQPENNKELLMPAVKTA